MTIKLRSPAQLKYRTKLGQMAVGDSLAILKQIPSQSINAIVTSPPFALTRVKSYGNEPEDQYIDWFLQFAQEFYRVLKEDGSLVIDLGGAWLPGKPIRSLYQYRLLIALHDQTGFELAEDFYWYNPAKIPGPSEWVTKRRVRVKDSVNLVWWLCKSESPKANNRGVLVPYSESMKKLLRDKNYNRAERPSGHRPGKNWAIDQGGAIPSNVIEAVADGLDNFMSIANTSSGDLYLKHCRTLGIQTHPARFPRALPEFFIRFLTEPGDTVLDPFAGSNMTGAVANENGRTWISIDLDEEFARGSVGRFVEDPGLEVIDPRWKSDLGVIASLKAAPEAGSKPSLGSA